MPKFLDAPSWYDSDGELREIAGYYSVGANYGAFRIPALSETSSFPFGNTIYVSTTSPGDGQVCVSSTGNLTMTSGGTTGDVLIKTASGAPSWKNGTSSVIKIIGYQDTTHKFAGTFVLPGKYDIGHSFTGSDLYTTLNDLLGNGTDDPDNNSYFPASGFVWWGSLSSGWNMIGLGAYPGTSSSYRYIQFFYIRYGTDYNTSAPVIDNRGLNYSSIESAVVVSNIP